MSNILMVCPRDYTLRTRMGHVIKFVGGEPTPVAEAAYAEAIAKNIVPVERLDDDKPAFGMIRAEIKGTLRDAIIFHALDEIAQRNQSEDFTGGGVPTAVAVTTATGLRISASEVGKFWINYRELLAQNDSIPSHPQLEVVRELQGCVTRAQLTEFAKDHGVNMPKAGKVSVGELKELLLNSVIHHLPLPPAPDDYVKPSTLQED